METGSIKWNVIAIKVVAINAIILLCNEVKITCHFKRMREISFKGISVGYVAFGVIYWNRLLLVNPLEMTGKLNTK